MKSNFWAYLFQPLDRTFLKSLKAQYRKNGTDWTNRQPNEHIMKARFCAIFSDVCNKTPSVGRAAKDFECAGIMPFSADILQKRSLLFHHC
jgi:hypothetical protein